MNSNDTEEGRRLHKSSPLFILIAAVKQLIIPLFFGGVYYKTSDNATYLIVGATLFVGLLPMLKYWFYHYWLTDDKIEIKEGLFFKKNRKIPYTRIQNVNVSQNILQRIMQVATLQLESASGGKPEAVMRVVTLDVVEEIKARVKASGSASPLSSVTADREAPEAKKNTPLLELPTIDVIKYGIISQKGMFFGAILFGFLAQNQKLIAYVTTNLGRFYEIPDFAKISLAQGLIYVSVIGLVIFIFLQLLSILWALLKFYQFKILKHGDRLQAEMGLLSKVSATIPLKRIQLYRISENPLHKYYKARTITIETAGGVNTDKSGIVMRWLAPYINTTDVKDFMHEIEPKIKLGVVDWQLIPYRAWRRVLKRSLFTLAFISAIIIGIASLPQVEIKYYAWVVMLLMIPAIFLYAKNYVKKTAYFINDDIICFKSGVWFGKQSFVKINKIQTVEVHESPFDRRNQMATLEIDTAGSNPLLHHVKIPYLEIADAYKIRSFIQKKLKESEFNW